jgi:hypothetical protein
MASTEPRSGLKYAWGTGFNGWGADMDANLLLIGRFGFHLSVKDRDLTAPPGTPITGDTYICATGSTGDWAGKDGQVAIYDGSAWQFGAPRIGWVAYIEDEEKLSAYKAAGWSAGVAI